MNHQEKYAINCWKVLTEREFVFDFETVSGQCPLATYRKRVDVMKEQVRAAQLTGGNSAA